MDKLHKARANISFPEYQRQPNLWTIERKRLLIDSILSDIDIPKLYFNETDEGLEVVDGTQRLWSIWEFIDDVWPIEFGGEPRTYSALPSAQRRTIKDFKLQVTIFDDADDSYLRELFVRLQLGLLLVTGERLNAATGTMKDFVFGPLVESAFVVALRIQRRRFAKETLAAQMAINSFSRSRLQAFARTRYEDLKFFFEEFAHPQGDQKKFFAKHSSAMLEVLDDLSLTFGDAAADLRNRSYTLSIYLLFEDIRSGLSKKDRKRFVEFVFALWNRLKEETNAGIDRSNRELYTFETMVSSAPGEKYQIERRHQKLVEYFGHFTKTGKIKGD